MIETWTKIPKEVADYINGYPAFNSGGGCIDNNFFGSWFSRNAYDVVSDRIIGGKLDMDYLKSTGLSDAEFWEQVAPAINTIWTINGRDSFQMVTMEMAEKLLRFIEPAWCRYKGIDSTGYLSNTGLQLASELLDDDDMLDI